MTNDEFRYVKLEGEEGIIAKTDLLSTQMNLLRLLKAIKGYHTARLKELKAKSALLTGIKEVNQNVKKIQLNIPKLTTYKFIEKETKPEIKLSRKEETMKTSEDRSLERELREIQEKLNALQI